MRAERPTSEWHHSFIIPTAGNARNPWPLRDDPPRRGCLRCRAEPQVAWSPGDIVGISMDLSGTLPSIPEECPSVKSGLLDHLCPVLSLSGRASMNLTHQRDEGVSPRFGRTPLSSCAVKCWPKPRLPVCPSGWPDWPLTLSSSCGS
jgi:hypothetical protein